MGYTTYFTGHFDLDKPLEEKHAASISAMNLKRFAPGFKTTTISPLLSIVLVGNLLMTSIWK